MKLDAMPQEVADRVEAMNEGFPDDATPPPVRRLDRGLAGGQGGGCVLPAAEVEAQPPDRAAGSETGLSSAVPLGKVDLVDHRYQEFCRRRNRGEAVDPEVYCSRFPSMTSSLVRLVQCQMLLEQHSTLFAETPNIQWPVIGATFHDYHLKLELGKGAFARVYLATEPKLGNRLVAVKVALHGAAEADVLGRIRHPNIVPVYSVHEDQASGLTAVCMPYVGSATLHDLLDRAFDSTKAGGARTARVVLETGQELPYPLDPSAHPCTPDPLLQNGTYVDGVRLIGAQLAEALAYLHANGICHRDLKPSNVLLSPAGVPLLLDFNLCADARASQNRLGGTMPYMSPEQLRATDEKDSEAALDARSDVYSLGVILYELATGAHPFGPLPLKLTSAQLRRHLMERQQAGPIEARLVNPDVDAGFSRLIQHSLALDPKDRPQTATEVALALRRALAPLARTKRLIAHHPRKTFALVLLLAVLGLATIALAVARPPLSERQYEAGLRLYGEGRYGQAVQHFNDVLQADPYNDSARFARARAHQQLGAEDMDQYNLAIQDYLEADRQNPDGRNKAALGYCLNRTEGRTKGAVEYYRQAIKAGFDQPEVYNNLGFSYQQLGRSKWKDAKSCLDEAIKRDPKLQAAYHNRAFLALQQALGNDHRLSAKASETYRDLQLGIADAQKAIDLGSPSAELYFDAACLCALAAKIDGKWTAPALSHLKDSIDSGCDPTKCNDFAFTDLRTHDRFTPLANGPAGKPFSPTRRLVDPILNHAR